MKLVESVAGVLADLVAHHAAFGKSELEEPYVSLRRIQGEGISLSISLTKDGVGIVSSLVEEILRERPRLQELYSKEYVNGLIIQTLAEIGAQAVTVDFSRVAKAVLSSIRESGEHWFVVTVVENLRLPDDLAIADVHLYPGEPASVDSIFAQVKGRTRAPVERSTYDRFAKSRGAPCLAAVEVVAAEDKKAIEKALWRIDSALDILRLVEPWAVFGITGYHLEGSYALVCIGIEGGSLVQSFEPVRDLWPCLLTREATHFVRTDQSMAKLAQLLRDGPSSDMEERLLRALAWFGKSVQERDSRNRILSAWIGLETLLLRPFESGRAEAISERAAFLLAGDEARRLEVYELGQEAGRARNAVTHRGEVEIREGVVDACVGLLRDTILSITDIITQVPTIHALKGHLDKLKFA